MPLVGAAITPHSPLLLPTVGKEYHSQLKKTHRSMATIITSIYALHPELIIVLHPHGSRREEGFTATVSDRFTAHFSEFGDLVTASEWRGGSQWAQHLQQYAHSQRFPFVLVHESVLPYDVSIPLLGFPEQVSKPSLLPIAPCGLDRLTHVSMGRVLADAIHLLRPRVFVIASVELSQHASPAAQGGMLPEGQQFDHAIVRSLVKKHWDEQLVRLDPHIVDLAEPCGYTSLLMLAGILSKQNLHAHKLSYESPFGTGMLCAFLQPA